MRSAALPFSGSGLAGASLSLRLRAARAAAVAAALGGAGLPAARDLGICSICGQSSARVLGVRYALSHRQSRDRLINHLAR